MSMTAPVFEPSFRLSVGSGRFAQMVGLLAGLLLAGSAASLLPPHEGDSIAAASSQATSAEAGVLFNDAGEVIIPPVPTDGVLTISIPPGTGEAMAAGGNGYLLPPVIKLKLGDRVVIHNNDVYPHFMLFEFVMPGKTVERTFTETGSETYSAGCTIDPTPNGFTSLFVSE